MISMQHINTFEDKQLIEVITTQGDATGRLFNELVSRHCTALLARLRVILGNPHDAEDMAQETWLRVYRFLNNFRGEASFRTWLFSIAEKQCYTLFTRQQQKQRLVTEVQNTTWEDQAVLENTQESQLLQEEQAQLVNTALSRLPVAARNVVSLRFYKEHTSKDIAHTLGLNNSASKMRLQRAVDQFRKSFEQYCA